jgi:tetratricopeptide (TPR) repeat protein
MTLSTRLFVVAALLLAPAACDNRPEAAPAPAASAPADSAAPAAPSGDAAEAEAHYLRALEYEAAGRNVEAREEVDHAIALGAGRDAKLLAAKLAILREDLAGATALLEPLVAADPKDATAQYNLGLIAQRKGEYNRSRTAYLAALRADPNHAASRFNLAVLTWDAGVKEEAQHHARKFLELSPGDPRGAELAARVQLEQPPAAPGTAAAPRPADTRSPAPDPRGGATGGKDPRAPAAAGSDGLKNPFAPSKQAAAPADRPRAG